MLSEFNLNFFIIFSLISFFSTFFITKYSHKFFSGSLLDKDFLKPQAFHKKATGRVGGIAILFLFCLFILSYFFIFDIFSNQYEVSFFKKHFDYVKVIYSEESIHPLKRLCCKAFKS